MKKEKKRKSPLPPKSGLQGQSSTLDAKSQEESSGVAGNLSKIRRFGSKLAKYIFNVRFILFLVLLATFAVSIGLILSNHKHQFSVDKTAYSELSIVERETLKYHLDSAEMEQLKSLEEPISIDSNWANMPYSALQRLSIRIFGNISTIPLLLPSLIFGAITAMILIHLTRRIAFTRPKTAVFAALLLLTFPPFLSATVTATPEIAYMFWPSLILLLTIIFLKDVVYPRKIQRILKNSIPVSLAILIPVSILTPYMFMFSIPVLILFASFPALRNKLRETSKTIRIVAVAVLVILLAPIVYNCIVNPETFRSLVLPEASLELIGKFPALARPFLNLPILLLTIAGVAGYNHLRTDMTKRSFFILSLFTIVTSAGIYFMNPGSVVILFVPFIIMITLGIKKSIGLWFRIFPRNPYARTFGLFFALLAIVLILATNVFFISLI